MISVAEAKKIITENKLVLAAIPLPLRDALQMRLAEDIYSVADVPAFPQSSMDGYAFAYKDYQSKNKLLVNGQMQAGAKTPFSITTGQAVRIFTGAPCPMAQIR